MEVRNNGLLFYSAQRALNQEPRVCRNDVVEFIFVDHF